LRRMPRALDIARRHFCAGEIAAIAAAAEPSRSERFLACWTRKEACIKALGLGIAENLNRFEVGTDEGELLLPRGPRPAVALRSFRPDPSHIAAIACI
jgi:4'-phosphopantetheinyl transferase